MYNFTEIKFRPKSNNRPTNTTFIIKSKKCLVKFPWESQIILVPSKYFTSMDYKLFSCDNFARG